MKRTECLYAAEAKMLMDAIRKLAASEKNMDNMESYLSCHFSSWMDYYAADPEDMAREFKEFAEMEI